MSSIYDSPRAALDHLNDLVEANFFYVSYRTRDRRAALIMSRKRLETGWKRYVPKTLITCLPVFKICRNVNLHICHMFPRSIDDVAADQAMHCCERI